LSAHQNNFYMNPITFQIEKDGNEYHTWCPELTGCHSHGKTVKEAINNLKDAIQLYLDVMMEEQIAKKSLELAE
jgi:predicted RNase H-like HicB family nuclease